MGFFPEIQFLPVMDLVPYLFGAAIPEQYQDELGVYLDEIAERIARDPNDLVSLLVEAATIGDALRKRAALFGLSLVEKERAELHSVRIHELIQLLLSSDDDMVLAATIECASRLGYCSLVERVCIYLSNNSANVVGSALRFISRCCKDDAIPVLVSALSSRDPTVRQYALDEIDEVCAVAAIPQVQKMLSDSDENVRLAAKTTLDNLLSLGAEVPDSV